MSQLLNFSNPHKTKIIEDLSFNDRSIVAFYNGEEKQYMLLLFHVCEQPNKVARESIYSSWGYVTAGVNNIYSLDELNKLVKMYCDDILANRCFWEKDYD
jgi:hypothetical protein